MQQTIKQVFYGLFLISMLCFTLTAAYANDSIAPGIVHDAPAVIQTPDLTINITITDDVELAYVGFGEETPPFSNIQQDVVSPGLNSVTLTKNLNNLAEGEHRYMVVAADTAGNVSKMPIIISYAPAALPVETVLLSDAVALSKIDLWTVEFVDVATITVRGPENTVIVNSDQVVIACVGSSGEVSFDPALAGEVSGFGVAIAGNISGAGEYLITVEAGGNNTTLATTLALNEQTDLFGSVSRQMLAACP